tara:strand:+ start:2718 stop:3656 length:939 start_codon:yes stop_codon:yes gene_type:complete
MCLKKYQLSSVFLILFIFFLSNKNSLAIENKIILKVNNEIITSVDVFNEAKYLKTLNKNLKNISDKEIIKLAKNSLLREKIKIIELSKYPEVSVNKEYLENIIKTIYTNLGLINKKQFLNYLSKYNIDIKVVEQKLSNEALWNQLIFEKFKDKIKINKDKIKKEIVSLKKYSTTYNLNEILYNVKKKDEQEKIFLEIQESIKLNGFENTASLFSVSESSKTGGKIGWINEGSINKEILKRLVKLEVGEFTQPIQTPAGFLVLNLVDKKKREQVFNIDEELSLRVKNLQNQQLNQFSNIYFNKIKKDIKINEK